jgi:hypothetical protein
VPFGACERACVDVAARTGILGWIDVADGAERGEERIHGSGFVRAWQIQSMFNIDSRSAIFQNACSVLLLLLLLLLCCTRKMSFCRYQYLSAPYYHSLTAIFFFVSPASRADPCTRSVAFPEEPAEPVHRKSSIPTTHTDFMPGPASGTSRTIQKPVNHANYHFSFRLTSPPASSVHAG